MKVLGIATRSRNALYGAVVERKRTNVVVERYVEASLIGTSFEDALKALIDAAGGVSDVAFIAAPPDVLIAPIAGQEHLGNRERAKSGHLRAEASGFVSPDRIRTIAGPSGTAYVAAIKHGSIKQFAAAAKSVGARIGFIDHEAYAWSAIMPAGVQALVIVDEAEVRLIVTGAEQVELGVYPWNQREASSSRVIAESIAGALVAASKGRFADVTRLALWDPAGALGALADAIPSVNVVPFSLAIDSDRTPWALAVGVAYRAVRGSSRRRLFVNFADRVGVAEEFLTRISSSVTLGDVALVGVGCALVVAMCVWRAETITDLDRRAMQTELLLVQAKTKAADVERLARSVALSRGIIAIADETRRSGPISAREVAAIAARVQPGASASALNAEGAGWSLKGHAQTDERLANLLGNLTGAGFAPAISATDEQNGRIAYSLNLSRKMR